MKDGLISGGLLLVGRRERGEKAERRTRDPIDLLWSAHVLYNSSTPTTTAGAIKTPAMLPRAAAFASLIRADVLFFFFLHRSQAIFQVLVAGGGGFKMRRQAPGKASVSSPFSFFFVEKIDKEKIEKLKRTNIQQKVMISQGVLSIFFSSFFSVSDRSVSDRSNSSLVKGGSLTFSEAG